MVLENPWCIIIIHEQTYILCIYKMEPLYIVLLFSIFWFCYRLDTKGYFLVLLSGEKLLWHRKAVNKASDCLSPTFSPSCLISPQFFLSPASPSPFVCLSRSPLVSQALRIKTPEKAWLTTEKRKRWEKSIGTRCMTHGLSTCHVD